MKSEISADEGAGSHRFVQLRDDGRQRSLQCALSPLERIRRYAWLGLVTGV